MSDPQALAAFLDKWRERWPEWSVAEVFVAAAQRETAVAWFALLQELTDAAWAGDDPRPGEAKLGWWAEELIGWSQNRRRHPLGLVLQRLPAPWTRLATALPSFLATREPATNRDAAFANAMPMAEAVCVIGASLFPEAAGEGTQVESLLARQLLLRGDAAAPLQLRARLGDAVAEHGLARAWAEDLLQGWAAARASRPERIFDALLRRRVQQVAKAGAPTAPAARLAALWTSWRAARG